ncbi:hypothetical protein [Planktothricoides sp. SR001]|uniref:hypothetical protein n=2 Tax=Planktothricoides TaxID=132607 RepID=UPI0012E169EE|nr:hypothetical protein [Planktothricoides sp. SR001]
MAILPYDFCTGEWPFSPTTFVRANGHSPLRLLYGRMAILPYDFCTGEWPFAPTSFNF